MQSIIEAVIAEGKKHSAKEINKVFLEIGELTFLEEEQLRFAFDILKEGTILEKAELIIKKIETKVKCQCGYEGKIEYGLKDDFHIMFPILRCPKCGGNVEILKGRECLIKKVEMEI